MHRLKRLGPDRSGCFVATAAYGPHDPLVLLLQQYRDRVLEEARLGRTMVRLYYWVSPPVARFFEVSSPRRLVARVLLRPALILARVHLWLHDD
jgi:hypothetical protein